MLVEISKGVCLCPNCESQAFVLSMDEYYGRSVPRLRMTRNVDLFVRFENTFDPPFETSDYQGGIKMVTHHPFSALRSIRDSVFYCAGCAMRIQFPPAVHVVFDVRSR